MEKRQKNTAEVFVKCLEAEGIQYIFGVPGEENLTFMEAIRSSKITFITTRHEQGAVFMAATIGRLTGKVGVALSTLGPGATNLFTGVAHGASIFTSDMKKAKRIIPQIEAGNVCVNDMVKSDPHPPFGGVKKSGYGRELGTYGIKEFVNIKNVWIA